MSPSRTFVALGAASAFLAVAAGAFGAHALKARLPLESLAVFETGARYQMYHALALIVVGLVIERDWAAGSGMVAGAGWLFVAGTVLFSGSLYALAITDHRWLGAVTPLGGLAFLAGWLLLAVGMVRSGQ